MCGSPPATGVRPAGLGKGLWRARVWAGGLGRSKSTLVAGQEALNTMFPSPTAAQLPGDPRQQRLVHKLSISIYIRIINPHLPPAFSSGPPGRDAHYFLPSCSPAPQPPTRRAASVGLLRASQLRASAKMDLDSKGVDPAGRCRCWRWRSRSTTPYSRGDYRHECDTSVTATTRCAAGARAVTR